MENKITQMVGQKNNGITELVFILDRSGSMAGMEDDTIGGFNAMITGQQIGATATATALTDEEWIYNEAKSTASGVVYANDKTVLDLYYDQNPEVA